MARPMHKDQDFASILHYWLDIHVLLINFSIPFYLGISLWKSWGPTGAENIRNGHTVTILTVGTGGIFDQRIVGGNDVPRPVQLHRSVMQNEN